MKATVTNNAYKLIRRRMFLGDGTPVFVTLPFWKWFIIDSKIAVNGGGFVERGVCN